VVFLLILLNFINVDILGSGFISAVETGGFFGGIDAGYVTDWLKKKVRLITDYYCYKDY
jgi:fructose-specific phosphotransferase system IIC component